MDNSYDRLANQERSRELSQRLMEGFTGGSSTMKKQAEDLTNAFTREMLMENSFMHKILPAEELAPTDLTEDINERKPYKLVPMEPRSRGAITVQFATVPNTMNFDSRYYRVPFNRIISPRLTMDTMELMRYRYDIRQVLLDKQTKYIELEKDRRFLAAVNDALVLTQTLGSIGNAYEGQTGDAPQLRTYNSGLVRENIVDAVMMMSETAAHLMPKCALCNIKTYSEFAKWYREEMGGGNTAEDIILNGMGERQFLGLNWITSIKHELLPNGFVYFFAPEDYLGKHYIMEDLTMWVDHQAYLLTTFQWTMSGAAIGNISGLALADFTPGTLSDGGKPFATVA